MRAAVYARFSSDLQRDTSIDDQVAVAHRYAATQGWSVIPDHVYTDAAISGASLERPGIQALRLAAARRPLPFDVLLVDDSSRVSRDLADAVRLLQELRFNGVRVIYISQSIDSASEQAETLIAVHGVVDSLYLRELSKKTKRGLAGQLERGFATGSSTYGYRTFPMYDPSGKNDEHGRPAILGKRIAIEPTEARVVVRIFELCASGLGTLRIIEQLRDAGLPGPRGGTWKCGAVKRVLANERYIGRWTWGRKVFERRPGTGQRVARVAPHDQWHTQERPDLRIVPDDLWERVQARREQVRAALPTSGDGLRTLMRGRSWLHSPNLFVGFLRCGVCGGAVTIVYGRPTDIRYGCSRSLRNGRDACDNRVTIRAKLADALLLEGLRRELLAPATVRYVTGAVTKALNQIIDERPTREAEVRAAREQAAQRLQRLIAAIESGVAPQTLATAIREREADVARLQAELEQFAEPWHQRLAVIPGWVENQLRDLTAILGEAPERVKLEFQRLGLRVVMQPIREAGARPFYRATGTAALPMLSGTQNLTGQTVDRFLR